MSRLKYVTRLKVSYCYLQLWQNEYHDITWSTHNVMIRLLLVHYLVYCVTKHEQLYLSNVNTTHIHTTLHYICTHDTVHIESSKLSQYHEFLCHHKIFLYHNLWLTDHKISDVQYYKLYCQYCYIDIFPHVHIWIKLMVKLLF